MSAWIVSKRHIDHMVTALIARELVSPLEADPIGRMLWRENLKSVAYRYPSDVDGTRPGPMSFRDGDVERYEWRETPVLDDLQTLVTFHCYGYQSCEHPGWDPSLSKALCERLEATIPEEAKLRYSRHAAADNDHIMEAWGWPDDEPLAARPDLIL
ncbi:MAG: hypothetical protein FWC87_00060 [Acidimicrobiaceae bacterium]|nr:hypothetical protein [Acidimicrobiaceae bacterium]